MPLDFRFIFWLVGDATGPVPGPNPQQRPMAGFFGFELAFLFQLFWNFCKLFY